MGRGKRKPRALPVRELQIEKLAPGGAGIAFVEERGERRAVFVPLTTPGDRVRAEVDDSQRPARGRLLTVIEASADRIAAPCEVAERCGGCDFMFLREDAQRSAHEALVGESLPAAVRDLGVSTYAPAADLRYRTRARLHVRAGRGGVDVGFLAAHSHELVAMRECLVLHPSLEAARRAIASWFEGAVGRGEARLALGAFPLRRAVVDIAWRGDVPAAFYAAIDRAQADGTLGGARVLLDGAARAATFGDPTPWMLGADGEPLSLVPGGFGQAADEGNALLGARVRALVEPLVARDSPIVELFAGAGNLTAILARLSTRVLSVESDEASCVAARANLEARGLEAKITSKNADEFPIARGAHLVVLDPPRTGAKAACERIADARARHVLYVSCDPPTLGRDLSALLEKRFTPVAVELVEMFPQTSHVETLVLLRHDSR